jgi:hypothetical protein
MQKERTMRGALSRRNNLGVVIGPDFAQLAANPGRNLIEGRVGILITVFEAV